MRARLSATAALLWLIGGLALADGVPDSVRVSRSDCRRLVDHVVRPDVAYRPGEHVVPADVKKRLRPRLPETLYIDITVDFCERVDPATGRKLCHADVPAAHGPVEKERYDAEASIGTVTVKGGGRRLYFNGQPLSDQHTALVYEACRRRIGRHRRPAAD